MILHTLTLIIILKWAGVGCEEHTGSCMTVGGPDPGSPCIFPFSFRGVAYRGCAQDEDGLWCSTKVRSLIRAGNELSRSFTITEKVPTRAQRL